MCVNCHLTKQCNVYSICNMSIVFQHVGWINKLNWNNIGMNLKQMNLNPKTA